MDQTIFAESVIEESDLFGFKEGQQHVCAQALQFLCDDKEAFFQDYTLVGYLLNPALTAEVRSSTMLGFILPGNTVVLPRYYRYSRVLGPGVPIAREHLGVSIRKYNTYRG